jgi:hypothetical protein
VLGKEAVGALPAGEGGAKTLSDLLALNIGQIGENLALGGARVVRAGRLYFVSPCSLHRPCC